VPTDTLNDRDVIIVGYPCPFEVDEVVLSCVEEDPIFGVKRLSQGKIFRHSTNQGTVFGIEFRVDPKISPAEKMLAICHNSSTLGGNSGSPVLCAKTGELLGVHFAGSRALLGAEAANLAMAVEMIIKHENAGK